MSPGFGSRATKVLKFIFGAKIGSGFIRILDFSAISIQKK
jgi:hypothetical protein